MEKNACAFFMGANTKNGFFSLFGDLAEENPNRPINVIKGGPGCGKSTLMKQLADGFSGQNRIERIYCASDPASLDGVVMDDIAILDGTAPHIADLKLAGVCGDYIVMPALLEPLELRRHTEKLRALTEGARGRYDAAYRNIKAASLVGDNMWQIASGFADFEKISRRGAGIISREIPKKGKKGAIKRRFLDGITPLGKIFLRETIEALAERVYLLCDSFGTGRFLLEQISGAAAAAGYEVYVCLAPIDPAVTRHVIIPELSLAFVTKDEDMEYFGEVYRRVRLDAMLRQDGYRRCRGKLKLMEKMKESLLEDGVAELAEAHRLHDEIEDIYHPHVDFEALSRLANVLRAQRGDSVPPLDPSSPLQR